MSINFTTKSVKFTGALKGFAEKQLQSIEKIAGEIIDAEVIVNEEKLSFKVEISMKTRLYSFYAESEDKILKQALRNTLTNLKAQAKKNKEKMKVEKKRSGKGGFFKRYLGAAAEAPVEARSGGIVYSESYSRKPITVEEAVFFLRESKENAYMFVNSETNKPAVVFLNRDKNLALIEPDL